MTEPLSKESITQERISQILQALSLHDHTTRVVKISNDMGDTEAVLPLEEPTIKGEARADLIDTLMDLLQTEV